MVVLARDVENITDGNPAAVSPTAKVEVPGAKAKQVSETTYVHGGIVPDPVTGAMLTPMYQTTAFKQWSVERYEESGYTYSRAANPTVRALENKIAEIESAKFPGVCHCTGMAATNSLFAAILETGDEVIVTRCSYGGTNRAARTLWGAQFGISIKFIDLTDLKVLRDSIVPGKTRMVLSETPSNPVLELADLRAISDICREKEREIVSQTAAEGELEAGAGPSRAFLKNRIIHVSDTTLAPPPVLKALNFGVDIVLISLTKYYCGHNMHLGGALITSDPELYGLLRFKQNVMGSIMAPNTAFSILQTAKTLYLRVVKQSQNALAIAKFLESHPKVLWVRYPGLKSHPQFEVAQKQHTNGINGAMVSFEVRGGSEAGRKVMNACTYPWTLAENLGAVESIMTCPRVFTHANMTAEARAKAGITDGMIRLSVGIEDENDLIQALKIAIDAA